jgi:hypothetical protein
VSHFSVIVVTDEEPTKGRLQKILLPWHEYECTGIEEYLVNVDKTDEVREQFQKPQKVVTLADGTVYSRWDDRFYAKPPKERWDRKGFELPAGAVESDIPADVARLHGIGYATLTECAKDYFGAFEHGGRFFRRTNPNKKWDWWQIGGRYSGKLHVKGGAMALTGDRSWTNKDEAIAGVDAAQRGNLDLDAMKREQQDHRRERAEDCCTKAKRPMSDLDIACRIAPKAHAEWLTLPEPRPRGGDYASWIEAHGGEWQILAAFQRACWELPEPSPNQNLTEWIDAAPAISSWAVVMDNQWFEKGKMGWWCMSSDDKANWEDHFNDLFGLIRDDQWVAVVDCHI